MQRFEPILPVPVLADPTKHQVANVVKVHEGEARESTKSVRDSCPTNETGDSRGGQNNVWGQTKGRASGSLLGCFQLPFASPDFMLDANLVTVVFIRYAIC